MRRLTRNIHWDSQNRTLYVQRRSSAADLPKLIARYRRELEVAPEQVSTRYLLANCLYGAGQVEEAKSEWAQVAEAGDEWASLVAEAWQVLSQKSGEDAA